MCALDDGWLLCVASSMQTEEEEIRTGRVVLTIGRGFAVQVFRNWFSDDWMSRVYGFDSTSMLRQQQVQYATTTTTTTTRKKKKKQTTPHMPSIVGSGLDFAMHFVLVLRPMYTHDIHVASLPYPQSACVRTTCTCTCTWLDVGVECANFWHPLRHSP